MSVAPKRMVVTLTAPGDLERFGARVEVTGTRAIVSRWEQATFLDGVWSVSLEEPLSAGSYQIVWRTSDGDPPEFEEFVGLAWSRPVVDGHAPAGAIAGAVSDPHAAHVGVIS